MGLSFLYCKFIKHTSLYNGRLVTGAHRQNLEDTACGPQQLLIGISSHDVDECLGATTGQDYQLHKQKANKYVDLSVKSRVTHCSLDVHKSVSCLTRFQHTSPPHLAFLVSIGQYLETVSGDGQKLDIGFAE